MLIAAVEDDRQERGRLPALSEDEVLDWADAFHARTGEWPTFESGPIPESARETWLLIEAALTFGLRGLSRGTLPRFLAEHRGWYDPGEQNLSIKQVLAWADAFHDRTGEWPTIESGRVAEAPGETWNQINSALREGTRGLPCEGSLVRLFALKRGVHNNPHLHRLTVPEILRWADLYHGRHGTWPTSRSGTIPEAPNLTWDTVHRAMIGGYRGLPGGSTLAQLLGNERGVRHRHDLAPFTVERILGWADAHRCRTGHWPKIRSGQIPQSPGDTWRKVQSALHHGSRGLAGGSSLARLLAEKRGRRHQLHPPDFTIPQILAWADAFHARTGRWPNCESGAIAEAPDDNWNSVDRALRKGKRSLPGGSSLARLLVKERGMRNRFRPPELTIPQILAWADRCQARSGRWPTDRSGSIPETPGETWSAVDSALRSGARGLPGGSSLARLRRQERPAK